MFGWEPTWTCTVRVHVKRTHVQHNRCGGTCGESLASQDVYTAVLTFQCNIVQLRSYYDDKLNVPKLTGNPGSSAMVYSSHLPGVRIARS